MTRRSALLLVAAVACLASSAGAQQPSSLPNAAPAPAVDTAVVVSRNAQISTMDRPSDAVRRPASPLAAPLPSTSPNVGDSKAMMIVGGAAFVAGALIEGDAGTVLMVGGAIVGLYGLWNYIR